MTTLTAARRAVLSALLIAIGLIHLLDLPGKWEETRWMGVAYLGLIAAAVVAADLALRTTLGRLPLLIAAGVAAGPMIGFILTRTTGLPDATGDIGNWLEPLGLASLFVEGVTVLLCAIAFTEHADRSAWLSDGTLPPQRMSGDVATSRSLVS
jgi:hypothetical protein